MGRVKKPTSTEMLEGGFVCDGRAKEKNKKRKREPRRRRHRLSTLMDDDDDDDDDNDDDDDDWVETRRRRRSGARHPSLWLFSTGRRTEKRPEMEKYCGAPLSCGFLCSISASEEGVFWPRYVIN